MLKKIISFFKNIYFISKKFQIMLDTSNRATYLLNSALNSKDRLTTEQPVTDKELIVSFTTYSKRIHDVHLVIESIGQQTIKPNKLVLWLDETEFTLDTIPLLLKKQIERGLDIRFCPNYKSYKKLIPTLVNYPDANIITIDDDVLYPHDMIELLCKEHKLYPEDIIGHRVHRINLNSQGYMLPYKKWVHEIEDCRSCLTHIAIGIGGIFYPAGALSSECTNVSQFTKLAHSADDIWFKAMSLLNSRKHKKVQDDRDFKSRFLLLETAQDIALVHSNVNNDGNDQQIKAVFEYYNLTKKL